MIIIGVLREAHDYDHVLPPTRDPTLEHEHTVVVIHVKDLEPLRAQRGHIAAQPTQIPHEAMEIVHGPVLREALPVEVEIRTLRIVGPEFIFQELLPHEQHRSSGRGQQQRIRNARTARCVPRPRVVASCEACDARLAVVARVRSILEVVVLDARVRAVGASK